MSEWRKSSRSFSNGACVQVKTAWRKSGRCANGDCVEAASPPGAVLVRDSKDPDGPRLVFSPSAWRTFLAAIAASGAAVAIALGAAAAPAMHYHGAPTAMHYHAGPELHYHG